LVLYTNADSLHNKINELNVIISSFQYNNNNNSNRLTAFVPDYTGRPVPEESHKLLINGFYSHWAKLYTHVITDNDHHLLQNG